MLTQYFVVLTKYTNFDLVCKNCDLDSCNFNLKSPNLNSQFYNCDIVSHNFFSFSWVEIRFYRIALHIESFLKVESEDFFFFINIYLIFYYLNIIFKQFIHFACSSAGSVKGATS